MRILVDTNILFSAVLFPKSNVAKTVIYILENHTVVLCDVIIKEFKEILKRKMPSKIPDGERFLSDLSYEIIYSDADTKVPIRDKKDQPILDAAIDSDVDIILTGDKDFLSLDLEKPRCMDVSTFSRIMMAYDVSKLIYDGGSIVSECLNVEKIEYR